MNFELVFELKLKNEVVTVFGNTPNNLKFLHIVEKGSINLLLKS